MSLGIQTGLEKKEIRMKLYQQLRNYVPVNEQEKADKEIMLRFIEENEDYLERSNKVGHFTTSIWTVNEKRTKTLMVYHNIYDSWSWIGGHADGVEDLKTVALRELEEETGVTGAKLLSEDIFSIEILTVDGHIKKGQYVPSHLHFNITYLAQADETKQLAINEEENQGVRWFSFDDALAVSTEPWMVKHVYQKLIENTTKKEVLEE